MNHRDISVHETHIGVVFLIGDRALKMKKPIRTDFLDFSTRRRRERMCHREVELNRRLAPDAYLGVADLLGPDRTPCEHLVVMVRMPADRRLSALVADGRSGVDEVRQVARVMAAFHARADRSAQIAAEGDRDALWNRWRGVIDGMRSAGVDVLGTDLVEAIDRSAARFLAGRAALFSNRVAEGRIVDGHGDLLAQDVFCLPEGPQILDCLEFDDRLRWVDGLDDAAFLAMDLHHRGRPDLADTFLRHYAELIGDPAPASLRHHYIAYRAAVRARVALIQAQQIAHSTDDSARRDLDEATEEARTHAELTMEHLNRGAVRLVLVGGLPGTGKSTIAEGLADQFGMVLLSTDRTRKELAGLDPTRSAPERYETGLYDPAMTGRTYTEMINRARPLLSLGESVVLDGSWTRDQHRRTASQLAEDTHTDLVAIRCHAPATVAADRLRTRTSTTSDADATIADAMAAAEDPWPQAYDLPTDRDERQTLAHAVDLLGPPRGDA